MGLLTSCTTSGSSGDGVVSISKVNPYHLQPGKRIETEDRMIRHEQRYHLHGAITTEDFQERFGHYYTIHWKTQQPGSPVTVRLDYTQGNTGAKVHTLEEQVVPERRSNSTKFRVTGADYETNGPVTSWKVSLIVGEQTVAESKSFLWK